MTTKISRNFFIISIMVVLVFIFVPAISVKAADAAPVHTNIDTSKKGGSQYITYKLTIDKTEVTDGRVVIGYDGDILELEIDSRGIGFSEEDINTKKENGKELFSYAFVNDEKKSAGGTLITLKFKVKDEVFRQNTAIDTQIISINNEDEEVLGNTSLSDTFLQENQNSKSLRSQILRSLCLAFMYHGKKTSMLTDIICIAVRQRRESTYRLRN